MSFRCFKSKSAIYGTIKNDNKTKLKSPLAWEESVLKSPTKNLNDIVNNDDSYQLHRSISDLSLFRLMDSNGKNSYSSIEDKSKMLTEFLGVSSDLSQQSWGISNRTEGMSNCSMEQLIDNWSKTSNYTNVSDSQKFISNLMSKKAFDVVKEPLRSLPREMSVKYAKESSNYLINSSEAILKDRSSINSNFKKSHLSSKHPPDKPLNDSIGNFSSGPLAIVRGIENRNSGGSSSVATPNSPQQSPLSLCSSSGGKSSDEQCYEDGLSEEELQQIAVRQQRQIQLQLDEIRQKQQQINKLKLQFEKTAKHSKVNPSIIKLKELYNQQEIKLKAIRNSKNQASQSKKNYESLKTDLSNFQVIVNSKKSELKKIEKHNEELKEYILYLQQRNNNSGSIPPNFEAFIRQKNSLLQTTQSVPEPSSHNHQNRCTDSQVSYHHAIPSVTTYPDQNRLIVRQMHPQNENFSTNNFIYCNTSDVSAFIPPSSNYRTKADTSGLSRAPPLPAHSYQRSSNQIMDKSQLQVLSDMNQSSQFQKSKRPPLPSYSDATVISANNKYSMLILQASRRNARTPTSSPPVVRRTSIVGLPYGKMPSRFASRNTINNVYIKKSSLETLEKYKKTASEIYKAQLSKFKSSSTDDVRIDEVQIPETQELADLKDDTNISENQITILESSQLDKSQDPTQNENGSMCSSCSSLSLPEDLVDIQPSTDQSGLVEETAFIQPIDDVNSSSENDNNLQYSSDSESPIWSSSVKKALEALNKEPNKRILKKPSLQSSPNQIKRNAHFHPHSLLLDAALEAEFDLVKEMSIKVENISEATDEGITALHNAVCSGREDIVKFLLDLGAHVNAGDTDGWTPLHCAASCNNVGMARLLVEYGASLFATSISDSEIPLQKCEVDDDVECEQYLFNQQDLLGIINDNRVYALFHYDPNNDDEFSIYPNQELKIIDKEPQGEPGWFLAADPNEATKVGLVPKAYVSCYRLVLPNKSNTALSECQKN